MAITKSFQPNFLLQALSGFAAGAGQQSQANRAEEKRLSRERDQAIGGAIGEGASTIFSAFARKKLMQDREILRRTGLTSDELDQMTPEGTSRFDMLQEIEKQQALKKMQTKIAMNAARQGYVKRLTPQDVQRKAGLMNEMNALISDPGIQGDDKFNQIQQITDELNQISPSWVYDPQAAAPRPTPQQQFARQTNTDEAGRIWSFTERGGWKLQFDPAKDQGKNQSKLIKEAEKNLSMKQTDDGIPVPFTPVDIAEEALRIQSERDRAGLLFGMTDEGRRIDVFRQGMARQAGISPELLQMPAGAQAPPQQAPQAQAPQEQAAQQMQVAQNASRALDDLMRAKGNDPGKLSAQELTIAKQHANALAEALVQIGPTLTPQQIDQLKPVMIYAKKVLKKNGRVPEVISIKNKNGSTSSEITITVNDPKLNNGNWTVIPSLVAGKKLDQPEAIQDAIDRGLIYPGMPGSGFRFSTHVEADKFAAERSKRGGAGTLGFLGKEPR